MIQYKNPLEDDEVWQLIKKIEKIVDGTEIHVGGGAMGYVFSSIVAQWLTVQPNITVDDHMKHLRLSIERKLILQGGKINEK